MSGKKIHFISGLPRSGSTLLCSILNQNPLFHATATSGVLDILFGARNQFNQIDAFNAMGEEEMHRKALLVLRGILYGYYSDVEQKVVFDKCRGWEAYMEMAELILGTSPKIICCVRDIREILASLERISQKTSATTQVRDERRMIEGGKTNYWNYQNAHSRCADRLSFEGGVVGAQIMRIKDAFQRGWGKHIHFVEFENLTSKPKRTMEDIYDFIGESAYIHDFVSVNQSTSENDLVHGFRGLHKIESVVKERETTWEKVIPKELAKNIEKDATFWRNL